MCQRLMHRLIVFETTPDLTEHTEQINKLASENGKIKEPYEKMKRDILETRYELEKQKNDKNNYFLWTLSTLKELSKNKPIFSIFLYLLFMSTDKQPI